MSAEEQIAELLKKAEATKIAHTMTMQALQKVADELALKAKALEIERDRLLEKLNILSECGYNVCYVCNGTGHFNDTDTPSVCDYCEGKKVLIS